ncbi:MAG TPA: class III extradiol ring-cleavage dioxygenase [Casimicrobiaceae bacterium]|nr:class III extradiol ring-cleavage dioxygenase [Casimicrobiaceae bacterium]
MLRSAAQATNGDLVSGRHTSVRLPTLFLSHGSPMHAIEPGAAGVAWAALGRELPRPRAVLIASAHWETSVPLLTGNPAPQTIHDFGGFPDELFRLQYAAPGDPALAEDAVALLKAAGVTAGIDGCRGRDHGAWVPLRWMYPDADVPVVQLAIQPELGAAHHLRVGRALAPLADDSVLIVGSGHTTHNLRDWMSNPRRQEPLRYAQAFAEWLHDRLIAHDVDALVAWRKRAPEAVRAHPSDEHFLPLFVALGAAADDAKVERFVEGFEAGALAMDSYRFGPH